MSKGKKGNKGPADNTDWDVGLIKEIVDDVSYINQLEVILHDIEPY